MSWYYDDLFEYGLWESDENKGSAGQTKLGEGEFRQIQGLWMESLKKSVETAEKLYKQYVNEYVNFRTEYDKLVEKDKRSKLPEFRKHVYKIAVAAVCGSIAEEALEKARELDYSKYQYHSKQNFEKFGNANILSAPALSTIISLAAKIVISNGEGLEGTVPRWDYKKLFTRTEIIGTTAVFKGNEKVGDFTINEESRYAFMVKEMEPVAKEVSEQIISGAAAAVGSGSGGGGDKKGFFSSLISKPKEMLGKVFDYFKKMYQTDKKKFGMVVGGIVGASVILYVLSKKVPIIGKIFRGIKNLLLVPFRLVGRFLGMGGKKVMALYEAYVSDPYFRRLYESSMNRLNMYIAMYYSI